ncbi:hypothetical protein BKA64DRAFT_120143 [Cadophora sp. MPI-SDFR-AT-0126]|nr:hypothetical protein BKA64DRAFT_120143 [Leotiomycetes sp. MPI-SDFR-AT-0126]
MHRPSSPTNLLHSHLIPYHPNPPHAHHNPKQRLQRQPRNVYVIHHIYLYPLSSLTLLFSPFPRPPPPHSQKAFTQADLPRNTTLPFRHINPILIHRRPIPVHIPNSTTSSPHSTRALQALPPLQLTLQTQSFLSLLIQSALCSAGGELPFAFAALQLVNSFEEFLDFVSGPGDVFLEGCVGFLLALDLQLQVLDGTIDVAN